MVGDIRRKLKKAEKRSEERTNCLKDGLDVKKNNTKVRLQGGVKESEKLMRQIYEMLLTTKF